MSGFDGRVICEGDIKRCKQLFGVAVKHANVQRQNKNILGLASMSKSYDLGGGAYCHIIDLGYMRSMRIVAPSFGGEEFEILIEEETPGVGPGVYDVLAGYTADPRIVLVDSTDAKGKPIQVEVLKHFKPTWRTEARHPTPLYRQQRLAVPENYIFAPFGTNPDVVWSQYAHVKPTNYTGLMRYVVQLVMGLGKVLRPTAEETMKLPPLPPIGTDGKPLYSAFGLYGHGETSWTPRVDFDYRAFKTHGVTIDKEGIAWVIEVAPRGVHAMKLYMDPVSLTKQGRARWIQVSPELEEFFNVFSGIPLGLTLPTFELFDKFKRAGEVIELISETDMRVFYSQQAMSSDIGWCFSEDGKEAHNTCYTYGIDEILRGSHYQIGINIQYEHFKPWTPARSSLSAKFRTIYEVNKCRRMSEGDAEQILRAYELGAEKGYKAFDEFEVKPTLTGTARMALQRKGNLYHPAPRKGQPQIKFPESMLDGLMSFDFSASSDPPKQHRVKCDTPMYVVYIQGQVEVISYSFDNTREPLHSETTLTNTRQECQWVGTWETVIKTPGYTDLQGHFYSNRWDFRREEFSGNTFTTTNTGWHIATYPLWTQDIPAQSTSFTAWTSLAFAVDSVSSSNVSDPHLKLSVAIPLHDRCAYYFATEEMSQPWPVNYSGQSYVLKAKVSEQWELYNFTWAWVGFSLNCDRKDFVDPGPLGCWGRKRCVLVDETACFDDYLIGGMWIEACTPTPPGRSWLAGPDWPGVELPSDYSYSAPDDPGFARGDIRFVNNTPLGEIVTKHDSGEYAQGTTLNFWWWTASPNDEGHFAQLRAVNSCLGAYPTSLNIDFDQSILRLGGPAYMWAGVDSCYIGVIE